MTGALDIEAMAEATSPRDGNTAGNQVPGRPLPLSAGARARRFAGRTSVRLPTGWPTFDAATRGGIPLGKLLVMVGAPGVGKTTLCVELGVKLARAGVHVAILAADEEADGLLVRIGQVLGLAREEIEDGNAAACERLAAELDQLPNLMLFDADENELTVNAVAELLAKAAGGAPAVLIIDSIQTARATGSDEADGPRARVDAIVAALRAAAKRGLLVLATSEAVRASYRSKRADEQINPLAAGKESGSIEFRAHGVLLLTEAEGEAGVVDVAIPKLRFGRKEPFRLRQDFASATFVETAHPNDVEQIEAREAAKSAKAKARVLKALGTFTNCTSANMVSRVAKGTKADNLHALAELEAGGEVVREGKCYRLAVSSGGGRAS